MPTVKITTPEIVPKSTDVIPNYTGTIPKNTCTISNGAVQGSNVHQLLQPSVTPNRECRSSMAFTQEALDVINECIKNGLEAVDTIKSQSNEIGPQLRKALTKVNQGTQLAIIFKNTISRVNAAIEAGDDEQVLKEFQVIVRDLHEMTNDDVLNLAEIIYMTYNRNLISSFIETDLELNDILNKTMDEKTKEIAVVLIARNQIILNALNYVSKIITERYNIERQRMINRRIGKTNDELLSEITPEEKNPLNSLRRSMNNSGTAKKLFILGENLPIPEATQLEATDIEIRIKSESNKPPTPGKDGKFRNRLNGYMRSPNGEMEEIVLELKQYIEEV